MTRTLGRVSTPAHGGNFCIIKEGLKNREDMAMWPSCSLLVNAIYVKDQFTRGETVPAPSADKELVKRLEEDMLDSKA